MAEGYIKFNCKWLKEEFQFTEKNYSNLEKCRSILYELGLIGIYPDGIGFGNISVRTENGTFIITGSTTGQFEKLNREHYAFVTSYSFETNSISCIGQTKASAESLSHAAIYQALPEVGAVVHVHCLWLWNKLVNNYPTTSGEIEYGTPEMAEAIRQLISGMKVDEKMIVMGGHREGILVFGSDLNEATSEIIKIYNKYQND